MKKLILGSILICSINILLASSNSGKISNNIAIGFNPADFTLVHNGKNIPSEVIIAIIEEELTNSNCSNGRSYVLVDTENPEAMKKYKETIEKENNNKQLDPNSKLTPHFITATHLVKGSAIVDNGCAMANLRIENRKGCVVAQKRVSVSGFTGKWQETIIRLLTEATSSLRHQICNTNLTEQNCSKSHYPDELYCPYYTIQTVVEKTEKQKPSMKTGGRNSDLITVTLKDTKQVVYIDTVKGKITNAPFPKETSGKKTTEKYKLNSLSCQYEIVKKVKKLPYHKASFSYLNNFSSSKEFTKDTVLDLQISSIKDKVIKVPWVRLIDTGRFSNSSSWTEKKSKVKKDTEVKKLFKLNAEGRAKIPKLKEVSNFGIAVEQALGQNAKDTKCGIQREFYDVLENGVDITHPKVSYRYKVNIYKSNKSDIKKAKKIIKHMENFSGGYTEEKQIYDALNNPLYAPKTVKKNKASSSEEYDNMTIDDLEMFTK